MTLSNHADPSAFTDEELRNSLQSVDSEIKELSNQKKRIVEVIVTRNADALDALLKAKDEPYGTVHIGDLEFTFGKKVTYNQAMLAKIARDIEAAGEYVSDYIKIEYDVPESKFKAWPQPIKDQFIPSRTIARGNPTVKIKDKE